MYFNIEDTHSCLSWLDEGIMLTLIIQHAILFEIIAHTDKEIDVVRHAYAHMLVSFSISNKLTYVFLV